MDRSIRAPFGGAGGFKIDSGKNGVANLDKGGITKGKADVNWKASSPGSVISLIFPSGMSKIVATSP